MNWKEYDQLFNEILVAENNEPPYDDADFLNYTKLNHARQNRWIKTGKLNEELCAVLHANQKKQTWTVITEPWCGDASHIVPFFEKLQTDIPLITVDFILRDSTDLINKYLTNGGQAIPILVVADEDGKEHFHWGPRPAATQELYLKLKKENADMNEMKIALQNWYNDDKGATLQAELLAQFKKIN